MTVLGDDFIKSCAACYRDKGLSVKLAEKGGELVCPLEGSHRYKIQNGMLVKL